MVWIWNETIRNIELFIILKMGNWPTKSAGGIKGATLFLFELIFSSMTLYAETTVVSLGVCQVFLLRLLPTSSNFSASDDSIGHGVSNLNIHYSFDCIMPSWQIPPSTPRGTSAISYGDKPKMEINCVKTHLVKR